MNFTIGVGWGYLLCVHRMTAGFFEEVVWSTLSSEHMKLLFFFFLFDLQETWENKCCVSYKQDTWNGDFTGVRKNTPVTKVKIRVIWGVLSTLDILPTFRATDYISKETYKTRCLAGNWFWWISKSQQWENLTVVRKQLAITSEPGNFLICYKCRTITGRYCIIMSCL